MRKVAFILLLFSGCNQEYITDREYPRLHPLTASRKSATTADLSAEIFYSSVPILDHGFVYSSAGDPTLTTGTKVSFGPRDSAGSYSYTITTLKFGVNYGVRAYAVCEKHVVYTTTVQL